MRVTRSCRDPLPSVEDHQGTTGASSTAANASLAEKGHRARPNASSYGDSYYNRALTSGYGFRSRLCPKPLEA